MRPRRFSSIMPAALAVLLATGAVVAGPAGAASPRSAPAGGYVSDALGIHRPGLADAGGASPSGSVVPMAGSGCAPTTVWGTSGQVFLQNGWYALAIRAGSCTNGTLFGYHEGPFYKNQATHGQFICRGHLTYGYGTNTWYNDLWDYPHGWSWAGGTNQPFWDGSC